MNQPRVAILISGSGSNMVSLVEDMKARGHAIPVAVISNRPDAGGIAKARDLGIETHVIDHKGFETRAAFDSALDDALQKIDPDVICMAGFMRVVGASVIEKWAGKILNIHPSILPLFPGLQTHKRAIEAGMAVHGASVHIVTPKLDDGPLIGQTVISVRTDDTADSLSKRLLPYEHRLYKEALFRFVTQGVTPFAIMEDDSPSP